MELLIRKLLDPEQARSAIQLSKSEDTQRLVWREIGRQLLDNRNVLPQALNQLMLIACMADFASQDECVEVATIFYRHIPDDDILPAVTVHHGRELAERCLIALTFFEKAVEHRQRFHGAPSPDFYRRVGQQEFLEAGQEDISEHFLYWESFWSERLN